MRFSEQQVNFLFSKMDFTYKKVGKKIFCIPISFYFNFISSPTMDLHYPNANLSTPLTTTIERSDPVILSMLIDKLPANLNQTLTQPCGKSALMHAAFRAKDPEVLQVLIKKGADRNKTDM